MRILPVALSLLLALAGGLYAAGSVILYEDAVNFPSGWIPSDSNTRKADAIGNPAPSIRLYTSYVMKDINIALYDDIKVSFDYYQILNVGALGLIAVCNFDYYDGSWKTLFSVNTTEISTYYSATGQYTLPSTASQIRMKSDVGLFSIDNIIITADKKPRLLPAETLGYKVLDPAIGTPADTFDFKIVYADGDNDAPTFVRLHIKRNGQTIPASPCIMDHLEGGYASGALYATSMTLSTGTYTYYFESSDGWLTSDTSAEHKRFDVVAVDPPTLPVNMSPKASDGATIATSSVELTWASSYTYDPGLTYTVLMATGTHSYYAPSRAPSTFKTIYTGPATSVTLTDLKPGTQYNWQVEATNSLRIKTTSPLYFFKTLAKTASIFNYPNPFNPGRQPTFIVYDVDTAQEVKIKIYSEYGSLVFEDTHSALPGSNEYSYDGKDNTGKTLYNGSYVCRIETSKGTSTCYLLIVK